MDAASGAERAYVGGHAHTHPETAAELVPLEVYRTGVLSRVEPLEPIELALLEAHGCVLSTSVTAPEDIPRFANSAMDGYAVVAASVRPGVGLEVVGEAAAGGPYPGTVEPGKAVRIMTGAPIPDGTDAVVPVELASAAADQVSFSVAPEPGANVRPAGEDVRAGAVVLEAGRRLGPAELGMLATVGRDAVMVRPRPRVVVLSTGDELVEPGRRLGPGQLYDSNSYMLTAMIREAGAQAFRQPIVPDDRGQLQEAFEGALSHADLLVTSGGVSAGLYDLVKEVMAHLGDVGFHKVGMQPGMPQAFGFVGRDQAQRIPCFGLPGNPVSAYVSFEVFVRPALRRLQGRTDLNRPRVVATLAQQVRSPDHKVSFLRVRLRRSDGRWLATPTGPQGSGILGSVVAADGLAEIPVERTEVPAGEQVLVHLLVDPA